MKKEITITLTLLFFLSLPAFANEGDNRRSGPPAEAIEACSGKADADSCSFEGRRGEVKGECRTMGREKVCLPQGRMEGKGGESGERKSSGKGAPPKEAMEACSGKSQGASCQIETPRGTLNGTCRAIENEIACVPEKRRATSGGERPKRSDSTQSERRK